MGLVVDRRNCLAALKRVKQNKGSPGIDGMTVGELPAHLKANWLSIREDLLAGRYRPQPVKRVAIPKPEGGERELDRFIQQALLQVLQPRFDPTFSAASYGFRPGRRALLANGVVVERHEGTPQGGPLSPLLANALLDEVDKEMEKPGHAFVRYADDLNVYVRSKAAGERVMTALRRLLTILRLRVNEAKSAVAPATQRQFLGFSFWVAKGRAVKRRIAPKAMSRMKDRVREITRRPGGRSLARVCEELKAYLVGWRNYFQIADTPKVFANIGQGIRHRLRALQLKHWKRGRTILRERQAT